MVRSILLAFALALAGCAASSLSNRPQVAGTASTRDVVGRYFAAIDARDAAAAMRLFAPEARYEDETYDFAVEGAAAIQLMLERALAALDPAERRILRQVYEGDQAMVEWEASGIHAGVALGMPPTGRRISFRIVSLFRVRDGRIISVTDYIDRVGLESQLRGTGGN